MGLYSNFAADNDLEKKGVVVDYGSFRVLLARAGGGNHAYTRMLTAETKPLRRAIQTGTIEPEQQMSLLRKVYSHTVVLDWETKVDGKFKRGIEPANGDTANLLEVTPDNIKATLDNLPDLFMDFKEQAEGLELYRKEELADTAKN